MGMEHVRRGHDAKRWIAKNLLSENAANRWEERIRRNTIERYDYIGLNDLVSYEFTKDYPDDISLHIHENLTKAPMDANRSMIEGMRLLADKLSTDPELAHIKWISGKSFIVYDHPEIMERLGFTIVERDDAEKLALAKMNRDAFVKKFASKSA